MRTNIAKRVVDGKVLNSDAIRQLRRIAKKAKKEVLVYENMDVYKNEMQKLAEGINP